jgi:hypothetical protein
MRQPFFEELEMDGMVSKNSYVEDITRHQLLQQVCHTHKAGGMAGTDTVGGEASCAWATSLCRGSVTHTLPFAPRAVTLFWSIIRPRSATILPLIGNPKER